MVGLNLATVGALEGAVVVKNCSQSSVRWNCTDLSCAGSMLLQEVHVMRTVLVKLLTHAYSCRKVSRVAILSADGLQQLQAAVQVVHLLQARANTCCMVKANRSETCWA